MNQKVGQWVAIMTLFTMILGAGIWLGTIQSSTSSNASDIDTLRMSDISDLRARMSSIENTLDDKFEGWAARTGEDALKRSVQEAQDAVRRLDELAGRHRSFMMLLRASRILARAASDVSWTREFLRKELGERRDVSLEYRSDAGTRLNQVDELVKQLVARNPPQWIAVEVGRVQQASNELRKRLNS